MARRGRYDDHLAQWRRRMTWFYTTRAKREEQAEDKPKPVAYYFEPEIAKHFKEVKQSEVTDYFDKDLVASLRNNTLTTKDTDGSK